MLPQLQRQVFGATAMEVLVRVQMAVDEAWHEKPAGQIDDVVGVSHAVRGLDRGDSLAFDHHIQRPGLEGQPHPS